MSTQEMLESILDSFAYPIVFVDRDYIIRFITGTRNTDSISSRK